MAAGSSQICDILGFLANLDRHQHARERCWGHAESDRRTENVNFLVIKTHVSRRFNRTHYKRAHYVADVIGGGRSSAMSRSTSENRFLGIATSAI
jgi:hypothetical protein